MAYQANYKLRRNINDEDETESSFSIMIVGQDEQTGDYIYESEPEGGLPSAEDLEWSNSGYVFKEWNSRADGSGDSLSVGYYIPVDSSIDFVHDESMYPLIFAIWEEPTPEPDPDPETTKYLVDAADLTSVANAIRAKSGKTSPLSFPDEFVDAIESFSDSPRSVQFIDYDGTLLYSYTPEEFSQLTELPPNPTHEGLIAQGWNWTLAEINTQLSAVQGAPVCVGQMYVTSDGKSHIYIHLADELLCSMRLCFAVNGTVEIDWGDGTVAETLTGVSTSTVKRSGVHTYQTVGDYTISLTVQSGEMAFVSTATNTGFLLHPTVEDNTLHRAYNALITKVEIGRAVIGLGEWAFFYCKNLKLITIPSSVTYIGDGAFHYNSSLLSATIPSGVIYIRTNLFAVCQSLLYVSIPSSVTHIYGYAFQSCQSLKSITIPSGVILIGTYAFDGCSILSSPMFVRVGETVNSSCFYNCLSLTSIVLLGSVVTLQSYSFFGCKNISSITIPSSVRTISNNAFGECVSLESIEVPNGVTSIESGTFSGCRALSSVSLPNTITEIKSSGFKNCRGLPSIILPNSLVNIGTEAFSGCGDLISITIPSSVTSIASKAFEYCGLHEVHFKSSTPPTASGSFITNVNSRACTIYVPYSEDHSILNAYKTAANYPNPNYYTYVEE